MRIASPIKRYCLLGLILKLFFAGSVQSDELREKLIMQPSVMPSYTTFLSKICRKLKESTVNSQTLEQAMIEKSLPEIYQITGVCKDDLITAKPEKPEQYISAPSINSVPSKKEIDSYLSKYWHSIEDKFWWLKDTSSQNAKTPLRAIAEVINGALDSYQMTNNRSDFDLAIKSAESLIKIQKEIATGGFGFPAWENNQSHLGKLAKKFLRHAKSQGLLNDVVRNGWIIDDLGRGDLYFDTGLAGEALIKIYLITGEPQFLQAAKLAGDWAMSKPAVVNFNYNAFSVILLSKLYKHTNEQQYLESAIEKTIAGIYSGMILNGKHAGHWLDPHNQRIVYRQIMLRATLVLLQVIPTDHPEYATLHQLYSLASKAMFSQLLKHGIANPDSTMLTYCENQQGDGSKPISTWPQPLMSDLQKIALKSLYRNKPFAGPAAVMCFLKDYSIEKGYL